MAEGIEVRHAKGCATERGRRCNCEPTYRASVWSPRERKLVRRTFKDRDEAKSWRADSRVALDKGALPPARRDRRTLADALRAFVEGMAAGTVRPKGRDAYKPNTIRAYRRAFANYLEDSDLGRLKVPEVRRSDVQDFADELLAAGLAPGTVSNILNPLQAFYRREIDRDRLAYNPAARIDLPAQGTARPKRIASASEAAELLAALSEDRALWATAFYAGLRRGELQALRCCDVDLGTSVIRVEHGWDQEEGEIDPKSDSSRRTVPLLAVLRDYLDEHLLASGGSGDALVFGRTESQPFAPMTTDKRAKRAWSEANARERQEAEREGREAELLEPITLHECRHTFASLLIDAGANPKAVQEYMGHSKIQTTFDTYGHLFPGSRDEVRERMDAYLKEASREKDGKKMQGISAPERPEATTETA